MKKRTGKIHRFFSRLFDFLISEGRAAQIEVTDKRLDARAVSCRIGEKGGGLTVWRVVIQLRSPTADFDNVSSINWESTEPPNVSEIVRHWEQHPQDFTFVDFLPNTKKARESSTACV